MRQLSSFSSRHVLHKTPVAFGTPHRQATPDEIKGGGSDLRGSKCVSDSRGCVDSREGEPESPGWVDWSIFRTWKGGRSGRSEVDLFEPHGPSVKDRFYQHIVLFYHWEVWTQVPPMPVETTALCFGTDHPCGGHPTMKQRSLFLQTDGTKWRCTRIFVSLIKHVRTSPQSFGRATSILLWSLLANQLLKKGRTRSVSRPLFVG